MEWNWQHKDWANFTYEESDFLHYEQQFAHNAGSMHGSMKHLDADDQEHLTIELLSEEALKTSEIEGEVMNRDSLQSSIRKHFGLKTDQRRVSPAEEGVSEVMVDLYRNAATPLTHDQLHQWHRMLTHGRRDLHDIGSYRSQPEPMQIVSGDIFNPTIHFQAPPSERVWDEMEEYVAWFNKSEGQVLTLIRAGISHIYFESIHPYEDGNGRIGRAIAEKVLSQGLHRPTLIAVAQTIEGNRKAYYQALQSASRKIDMTDWLHYFCEVVLTAQDHSQRSIDFLVQKGKFYRAHDQYLNDRQRKVIARMFREGVSGFKGGLSTENYLSITKTSRATATRDLQALVNCGAFTKTGHLKGTRYFLKLD